MCLGKPTYPPNTHTRHRRNCPGSVSHAHADPNRALLDRRVVCDLLGFDEGAYQAVRCLAAKWCAEPSVHGGKPRLKDATLIVW